jgi:hypothetical protein
MHNHKTHPQQYHTPTTKTQQKCERPQQFALTHSADYSPPFHVRRLRTFFTRDRGIANVCMGCEKRLLELPFGLRGFQPLWGGA